jgi:hypothetical protein
MPEFSATMRQRILHDLGAALKDVQAVATQSKPMKGYLGFQQVESRLSQARQAIEQFGDTRSVIDALKKLDSAITLVGIGDVAPAVTRTRALVAKLLKELATGE